MRSLFKNFSYNLLYQFSSVIFPLLLTPYISRVLGPDLIGNYSFTNSITMYFIMIGSLGFANYGQREIAYNQSDIQKRTKAFIEIMIMRSLSLIITIIFFYIYALQTDFYHIYLIFILMILASIVDIAWFYQGMEKFKNVCVKNFLVKFISFLLTFLLVKNESDFYIYIFILCVSTLISNLTLWFQLHRYITRIDFRILRFRKHILPAFSFLLPQICSSLYTVFDKIMIGKLSDLEQLGNYEQVNKMTALCLSLGTSFGTVMLPRMSNIYYKFKENSKEMNKCIDVSFQYCFLIALPASVAVFAISNEVCVAFFGKDFLYANSILKLLAPIIFTVSFENVTGSQYMIATNRQKLLTITIFTAAIINITFNMILIPIFGANGAAVATLFAESVVTVFQVFLLRNEINFISIFLKNRKKMLSCLLMLISLLILKFITNNLLILIMSGMIVYAISLAIFRDSIIYGLLRKIKHERNRE